ncbi:MAG: ArsB/NhaD family transporter [Acidimicrobiia bacterium]|nr:ArsB/NhaD family transporter [Acidimicrobiia bacterium]
MTELVAVAVFLVAYVLIATEWVHRVVVVLGAAGLLLTLRVVTGTDAFHSEEFGIDWNVIFLLFGMMVIVGVLKHTGLFGFIAIWSAKKAGGRPFRILVMLVLLTAAASALLDNVTTVLLMVPVTLLICERLGITPAPFLIAQVMASNIGGTATLIGDPPNIIIASEAGLSYFEFLVNLAPVVAVTMIVFIALVRVLFRKSLTFDPERAAALMALDEKEALQRGPLLNRSLWVLGGVTAGFALHGWLHYEPSVVALLGAGVLLLISGRNPEIFFRDVEWQTLVFFVGLFIMVGALVKTGVVGRLADAALDATDGSIFAGSMLLLSVSAVLSGVVDNIPYVATMAPLVTALIAGLPDAANADVLWWSLALGADYGGNLTAIGASANVVVLGLAERAGSRIRFLEFFKYGAVVTLVSMVIATAYVWIRYFPIAS